MMLQRSSLSMLSKTNKVKWRLNQIFLRQQINRITFCFSEHKSENTKSQFQITTYQPIRPLKKYLTPLYIQKQFLNQKRIKSRIPFWPYLSPLFALAINNFLTSWTFLNSSLASILFIGGIILRQGPNGKRERQIIKLECNHQMTKLYITILCSGRAKYISTNFQKSYKGFQEWGVFQEEDYKNPQYIPTEADKLTYSEQQLNSKKMQFDRKLFQKILKQKELQSTIRRYQLDTSKTLFKLANHYLAEIKDHDLIHQQLDIPVNEMMGAPFKYLIIRTQFHNLKIKRPYHFFIDLQENGDLRYQDYLVALGANFKISLGKQKKK